jgi:hypothetical protein
MRQDTRIRKPWIVNGNTTKWNETCAWAVEQFGLPGDRFTSHPTEDYMDFHFKDEKDAILFELRWG